MTKQDTPYELAPIDDNQLMLVHINQFDVSDILWRTRDEGMIRLAEMTDQHLRNTALMLIGMGYQAYNASDELKAKWLTVLRMEWEKRVRERRATKV